MDGSHDLPAEALLAHDAFLRRLARQLVGDDAGADDLVQDTWLAALRRPAGGDRGWLATIARNLLRNRHRDDTLRRIREAESAQDDWVVPAADVVARESVRQDLVNTVLALDEPYRSTVLLHFFEGLTSSAIGARAGVSAGTVRSRLKRGLDLLRGRLDARHGDRQTWVVGLLPWLRRTEPVLVGVAGGMIAMVMQKKVMLVALGVACAAALAVALTRGDEAAPNTARTGGSESASVTVAIPGDGLEPAEDVATRTEVAREPAAAPRFATARVVDAVTHEPVAGAQVYWHEGPSGSGMHAVLTDDRAARAASQSATTDSDGRARVPLPADWRRLFAREGERWGHAILRSAGEDPAEIALEHDSTVVAQVIGPDGRGLSDVPVVMANPGSEGDLLYARNAMPTDARGFARFEHAQEFFRPQDRRRVVIGLDLPLPARVQSPIDLTAASAEPVLLRVPAHGSAVIRLADASGEPYVPPGGVQLGIDVTAIDGARCSGTRSSTFLYESRLDLAPVGLGLRLRIRVESDWANGSIEVDGPTRDGERKEFVVPLEMRPILVGRLLDAQGRVLVRTNIQCLHVGTEVGTTFVHTETDDLGRFRVPVPELFDNPSAGRIMIVRRAQTEADAAQVRVALDALPNAKQNDLGDVVLRAAPVVLAGTVVDVTGAPVGGAALRIDNHAGNSKWSCQTTNRVTTAPDGSFAVRGAVSARRVSFVCTADGFAGVEQDFEPGTEHLTILMRGAGAIEAAVELPGDFDADSWNVTLTEDATGDRTTMSFHVCVREGRLHWDEVGIGRASIEMMPAGSFLPVARVDGIEVRPGETTTLEPIDLRGKVHPLRLTVRDPSGDLVPDAVAWLDPGTPRTGRWAASRAAGGRLELHITTEAADVGVTAPGYGIVTLRGVTQDREVELPRGMPIDIELTGPAWRDGELELRAELDVPDHHGGHRFFWSTASPFVVTDGPPARLGEERVRISQPGSTRLHVPVPGRYRLRLLAHPDLVARPWPLDIPTIEVEPGSPARVVVRYTAADLAKLP